MPASWQEDVVRFCQRLVQTPSPSGEEGDVAALIRAEMERLDYDDVRVDEVGNVVGLMKGNGGPSLMLNCHMDQVDVGDPAAWPYGPFSGRVEAGAVWGRGASDTKGAIAAQVYAVGLMKATRRPFPGDTYVACVVHEETCGWGTQLLLGQLRTDLAILGEATGNQIACGHRGRAELVVHFQGQSAHASVASREANPLFGLSAFLQRLQSLPLPEDAVLGRASLTPTLCYTDQKSSNVSPGQVSLHLDWRNLPGDAPEEMLEALRSILGEECPAGVSASVELPAQQVRSFTGMAASLPRGMPGYLLDRTHALVGGAQEILAAHLERPVSVSTWAFATDGSYLDRAGIPTIGFSPCEEQYAHTVQDRVQIALMIEAVLGTMALVAELPRHLAQGTDPR